MHAHAESPKSKRQIHPRSPERLRSGHGSSATDQWRTPAGNQSAQPLLQSNPVVLDEALPHSALPIQEAANNRIQPKLTVSTPHDQYEQEADRIADQVLRTSPQPEKNTGNAGKEIHRKPAQTKEHRSTGHSEAQVPRSVHETLRSQGHPMDQATRSFFEPRFGHDFSQVRIHTDPRASESAKAINAKAYTFGNQIVFSSSQYQPQTPQGRHLLAHELTHVVQQEGARDTDGGTVHRAVELRPPGRGEASAFDRANELVDRLNATSSAVTYALAADGRTLEYELIDGATPDGFDRMMTGFIDEAQVIPLRLITSQGLVQGPGGNFEPLTGDSFVSGYVDLDDLLGSSDIGFKLLLGHFITERLQVRDYARRIGTAGLVPLFNNAHARGRDAEALLLQDLLNDPSIEFHYDELKPDGTTFVRAFRSRDEGYRVFWVIRGHRVRAGISITDIRVVDGARRLTIEDFIAERAAAPAPAVP